MSTTSLGAHERRRALAALAIRLPGRTRYPGSLRLVAQAGGLALVWLAVVVPCASQRPLTADAVAAVTVAAAVWFAALRGAFAAGHPVVGVALPASIGTFTGLIVVAALNPWVPGMQLSPRTLIATGAGVFASAATWEWFVRRTSVGTRRVLVVGNDELGDCVAEELERSGARGFALVGRIDPGRPTDTLGAIPCLGEIDALSAVVKAQRPDLVVLADERTYALAVDRLLDVAAVGFRVVGLASFFEHAFGRVPLRYLTPAWFMGVLHLRQPVYARWSKRVFDVLVATVGVIFALPVLPALVLLVRRTPGPIIYRQVRIGEGGRPFTIYKFRTMVCGAEAPGEACWAAPNDERATSIGTFLRRTHLDELPQLWNVLRGDLAIVGPRPERPEFVEMLETAVPLWSRRLLVKPGVTGWAQVRCGYAADCESTTEKLSHDLWYIRHQNLAIDVAVCAKTFGLVLRSVVQGGCKDHALKSARSREGQP